MNKIENESQYAITKKRIQRLNEGIERINKKTTINPLRKELLLTSLEVAVKEMEQQLTEYASGNS